VAKNGGTGEKPWGMIFESGTKFFASPVKADFILHGTLEEESL
jgi:hypothetical protein